MKKYILVFLFLNFFNRSYCQVSSYVFSMPTVGTYTPLTSDTSLFSATWNDNVSSAIPLGFTFNYNGTNYTDCYISSNGFIKLGSTNAPIITNYNPISTNGAASNFTISGIGTNLGSDGTNLIKYKSVANTSFTVEWTHARRQGIATDDFNFQIKLFATGIIQIEYGTMTFSVPNGGTSEVGIRGSGNTDYNSRQTTSGSGNDWNTTIATTAVTQTCNIGAVITAPISGRIFQWDPPCPVINTQPTAQVKCAGQTATFTVAATGSGTLSYAWFKAPSTAVGTNSSTLTLTNVQTANAGNYFVVVTNSSGCTTQSSNASLTIDNPVINTQPVAQEECAGQTATFTVVATGSGTLSYAWFKSPSTAVGTNSSTLTLTNIQSANAGNYFVVVTSSTNGCTTQSSSVALTVDALPVINSQPAAQVKCAGQTATFTVGATGSATLSYAWFKSPSTAVGTNSSTLSLTNVQSADAGNYFVIVTSGQGCTTQSNSVALTIGNPVINTQPVAQEECAGQTATFTVGATGSGTLSYAWFKAPSTPVGTNSQTLSITNVQSANAGNYYVVITSSTSGCTTQSNSVALTVDALPVINTQPIAQVKCAGQTATFTVAATGVATLSYAWFKSPSTAVGTNSSTLTLTNVQSANTGSYFVVVTSGQGCTTQSSSASLTIDNPVINTQPVAQEECAGQTATFTVGATGSGTLSYAWFKAPSTSVGTNNSTLNLTNVQTANAGIYFVIVTSSNIGCTTQSNNVALTVDALPIINTQPAAQVECAGQTATFSVAATGIGTLSYAWFKAPSTPVGTNSQTLNLLNVQSTNVGSYFVIVTSSQGCTTQSNSAALTVNPVPVITNQPVAQVECAAQTANFTVVATGIGTLSYTWFKSPSTAVGTNSSTLNLTNVQSANAGNYFVVVTSSQGCTTQSNSVALTVNALPIIGTQPVAQGKCAGQNAAFSVSATGSGTLSYAWFKSPTTPVGTNSSTLILTNVQSANAGSYFVVVTSGQGCTTQSSSGALTVDPAATVDAGIPINICAGNAVPLNGSIGGSATSVSWTSSGTPGTIQPPISVNATYTPSNSDTQSVFVILTLTTNDPIGVCPAVSDTVRVTFVPLPVIQVTPLATAICSGDTTTLNVQSIGGTPANNFVWLPIGNLLNGNNTGINVIATALNSSSIPTTQLYTVTGTSTNLNCSITNTISITINPLPAIPTISGNAAPCAGKANELYTLPNSTPDATGQNVVYNWLGTGNTFGFLDPVGDSSQILVNYPNPGSAGTSLISVATNIFNCTSSDTMVITFNGSTVPSSAVFLFSNNPTTLAVAYNNTNSSTHYQWGKISRTNLSANLVAYNGENSQLIIQAAPNPDLNGALTDSFIVVDYWDGTDETCKQRAYYDDLQALNFVPLSIANPYNFTANNYFILYPNPSDNYFVLQFVNVSINSKVKISIFDITGKLIKNMEVGNHSEKLILNEDNSLSQGIYFIKYTNQFGGYQISKIMIQK